MSDTENKEKSDSDFTMPTTRSEKQIGRRVKKFIICLLKCIRPCRKNRKNTKDV